MRSLTFLMLCLVGATGCRAERGDSFTGDDGGLWNTGDATDTSAPSESEGDTHGGEGEGDAGNPCGDPVPGNFGDCVNVNHGTCGNAEAVCLGNRLQDPDFGVCTLPCQEACDCWDPPSGGTAIPACTAVSGSGEKSCVLDCTEGRVCPVEMRCSRVTAVTAFCVFDRQAEPDEDSGGMTESGTDE